MLQKNTSNKFAGLKFLMLIPLLGIMLTYVACSEDQSQDLELNENEVSVVDKIAELKTYLENKDSLTQEEKAQFVELLRRREELLIKEKYGKNPEIIEVVETDNSRYDGQADVPFAVIDKAPAFEGCDKWVDDPRRNCTSSEISKFVNENFNTDLGKELGLTGINRVIVQFKINASGKIVEVKARSSHPALEEEAKRVISSMPEMIPGEQNGQPVNVMYSLPIAFQVSE